MSDAVKRAVARGEYRVDEHAVAGAMVDRALAIRTSARMALEMLVPAQEIEIRRIGTGAGEPEALSIEDVA